MRLLPVFCFRAVVMHKDVEALRASGLRRLNGSIVLQVTCRRPSAYDDFALYVAFIYVIPLRAS